MIKEEYIEMAAESASAMDVVHRLYPNTVFKQSGSRYCACCFNHNDKSPSMFYYHENNKVHCFACKKSWSIFDIVMEAKNCSYPESVKYLLSEYRKDIGINQIYQNRTSEEIAHDKQRESQFAHMQKAHEYYVSQFYANSHVAQICRNYAERRENNPKGRWDESFCKFFGLGYSPADGHGLVDWASKHGLNLTTLEEIGLVRSKVNETTGEITYYDFFRNRLMIPQRDRWGRVIAYMGRRLHEGSEAKYVNNTCTNKNLIYKKGVAVFGIDMALKHARNALKMFLVEGAPDVMRLNSLGIFNVVACNSGHWTAEQLEQFRAINPKLCFIPDSDAGMETIYGVKIPRGMKFAIESAELAMSLGFEICIKEIPSAVGEKRDVDSYVENIEIWDALKEVNFIQWLAEKLIPSKQIDEDSHHAVQKICDLIVSVPQESTQKMILDNIKSTFGKKEQWNILYKEAQERHDKNLAQKEQKDTEHDLSNYQIVQRGLGYWIIHKDGRKKHLTNFLMKPLYHIETNETSRRIFEITFRHKDKIKTIVREIDQMEISYIAKFKHALGRMGNVRFWGDSNEYDKFLNYMYEEAVTVNMVDTMGWNKNARFYCFANSVYDENGDELPVDEYGMVSIGNETYYLPAFSKIGNDNPYLYVNQRRYAHIVNREVTMYDFFSLVTEMYGDNGAICLLYCVATMFRDVIFDVTRFFPMIFLFGPQGTGKTAFASVLTKLFKNETEILSLSNSSLWALGDSISEACNMLRAIDEYKHDMEMIRVDFMKGLHNSSGRSMRNEKTGERMQTKTECGIMITGQDIPNDDQALIARMIFLETYQSIRSISETNTFYTDLRSMEDAGLTQITVSFLKYRLAFERNFKSIWMKALRKMKEIDKHGGFEERIIETWTVPYATICAFESFGVTFPFTKKRIFDVCCAGIINQLEVMNSTDEVQTFWLLLVQALRNGHVREKQDFMIEELKKDLEVRKDRHAIILRKDQHHERLLFLSANNCIGKVRLEAKRQGFTINEGSLMSYVKHSQEYYGRSTVQKFFSMYDCNGNREKILVKNKDGVEEEKYSYVQERPLVFDYDTLHRMRGIDLEKVYSINPIVNEDNTEE